VVVCRSAADGQQEERCGKVHGRGGDES
jgi:hypothetical protein